MTDQEFSERLNRLIDAFEQSVERMGGSINRNAGSLNSLAAGLSSSTRASTAAGQAFQSLTGMAYTAANVDKVKAAAGEQLVKTFKDLIDVSRRATESMYGSQSGFASFRSTLQDAGQVFGKLHSALVLGLAASAPQAAVAVQALGKVIGTLSDHVGTLLGLMDRQRESYVRVNQVGAIFGGSLANMQIAAQSTGVALPILTQIILDNAEDLRMLGGGMSRNSTIVAKFAGDIARTNAPLLNLYGSTEELAKGTAQYLALQAQIGDREIANIDKQGDSLKAFLLRQKELTDITGKRAQQIKEEEAQRRRDLAYNMKVQRLTNKDARQNLMEGVAIAGQIGGDAGAKYAQEFFATGGKIVNKESLAFAATMPEAARAIAEMVSNVDVSKEEYRKKVGGYIEANKDAMLKEAKNNEYLAELAYSDALPQIARNMVTFSGTLSNSETYLENFNKTLKQLAEDEKLRKEGLVVTRDKEGKVVTGVDTTQQTIMTAEQERLKTALAIDKMVNDNFGKMNEVIAALGSAQRLQVSITDTLASAGASLASAISRIVNLATGNNPNAQRDIEQVERDLNRLRTNRSSNTNATNASATPLLDQVTPPRNQPAPPSTQTQPSPPENEETNRLLRNATQLLEQIRNALAG